MSATPSPTVSLIRGRLKAPPPEFSWRTRRDTRLTSTFGLPTFANAFLQSSLFIPLKFTIQFEPHTLMLRERNATGKTGNFMQFFSGEAGDLGKGEPK